MGMTRQCRCWPAAGRRPRGSGPMSAMTAPFSGAAPLAVVFKLCRDRSGEHPSAHIKGAGHPAGRCLCRIQPALSGRSQAGSRSARTMLGTWPPQVFRACGCRGQHPQGQAARGHLADRLRGGEADRQAVRDRARDQRSRCCRRLETRQRLSVLLVGELEAWLRAEHAQLSKHAKVPPQPKLHLGRQRVHPAAHVGDAACDPDLHSDRKRDHRLSTKERRRASASGHTLAGTAT